MGGGYEEIDGNDEAGALFLCLLCAEDLHIVGLCSHIDEYHPLEAKNGALANLFSTPMASGIDGDVLGSPYVAFDLDPSVVKAYRKLGFPILYGDASQPAVLESAGISSSKAVMIMYTGRKKTMEAFHRLRLAFPAAWVSLF